ncbi:hypothetical protein EJ08DRAFT_393486 [Tothia fuscella]|uniref:Uncharacterized protein n=1 Tax=Tothia fuscella TaxID=1048955 RepID=A0A9P4P218_9PEZI|nr:hypothetical protein EJ08DRAFT_393486 [Tothia fuscella]
MALSQDVPVKRRSSLRRLDFFRPHVAHSIASVARSNSTRSTNLTDPSEASPLFETHNEVGLFTSAFKHRHTLRKMPKTTQLVIDVTGHATSRPDTRDGLASPRIPHTPHSPSPRSPPPPRAPPVAEYGEGYDNHVTSPVNALPPPQHSPKSPKQRSHSIFSNMKGSKSSTKVNKLQSSSRPPLPDNAASSSSNVYTMKNQSSPDLSEEQWAERLREINARELSSGRSSPQQGMLY